MKLAELKKKSLAELSKILEETAQERFNLRMQKRSTYACRLRIAQIKTLQTQLKEQAGVH